MRTLTGCALVLLVAARALGEAPAGDWCRTMEMWLAKGGGRVPVGGNCPALGTCDVPSIRDEYIPDDSTTVRTVRVHLIVLREDNGANPAATEQEVVDQMIRMNNDFAPSRLAIQYTWEYVDDTTYRNGGNQDVMKELYAADPEHQCNIFVTDGSGGNGTFPWDPDSLTVHGGIVVGEFSFGGNSSVVSHELGHCLGLWHTHHGVSEVSPCSACWEQADGADGDVTGDRCADTPPTPVNFGCNDPSENDPCVGLPWGQTLPESYMSYGQPCWSLFTAQQAGRLRCWFDSSLSGWLVTCPGDGNTDGAVSLGDFLGLLAAWGSGDPGYDIAPAGGDGAVGILDFIAMLTLWGPCPLWEPEPPANDGCADAIAITHAITDFSTRGATTDGPPLPPECDEGTGPQIKKDVWYLYTPQCTGTAFVNSLTDFEERTAIYTGTCGSLTLVACNDSGASNFPVSCGQTYLIRMGGVGNDSSGTGTLYVSCFGDCP